MLLAPLVDSGTARYAKNAVRIMKRRLIFRTGSIDETVELP